MYSNSAKTDISLSKFASANIDKSSNIYKSVHQNIMELNEIKALYYSIEVFIDRLNYRANLTILHRLSKRNLMKRKSRLLYI
jgi:hypothetical protein